MLTLFQRLLLGGLLLLALITGLGLLVRASFVSLGSLDAEGRRMDRAVGALAAARAALAREQILIERSLLHLPASGSPGAAALPAPGEREIAAEGERAENRLLVARGTLAVLPGAPSLAAEIAAYQRVLARLKGGGGGEVPDLQGRMLAARTLEPIDRSVAGKLQALGDRRRLLDANLQFRREGLQARLISACAASLLTGVAVVAGMLWFVIHPLRRAAKAARRIGQGDLQQRIDWPRSDELGTLATELNRLAIRVRDLRETEAGRREMERQLSDAVVQSIFEPVIVTDGRGQVLRLNGAARELLGEAADDRMALTLTPGGEQVLAAIRTAVTMQQTVGSEAALAPIHSGRAAAGNAQKNFRLRTTPMRDSEGHLLGSVTVLEDVTELQALDRFKTQFLAVASQKLRDPLEKVRVAIHALARGYAGELRPLQADVIEGAQNEAQHLDDLMADLLAVAELDSGRRSLKTEKLRPLDVLREAQAGIRSLALERGLTVQVDAFADLQRVEADRRALRSIFDNLLTNAVRNTAAGGEIFLTAMESKQMVHFSVRDTGRGIEPERLKTIFGRFSSESSDGTGLGLALVRRLVEAQGGQISVESRMGVGTTFTFTLPAAALVESRHPVEAG